MSEDKGKSLMVNMEDYVCLDLETTGLNPNYHEIIDIGALRVRGGKPVVRFSTLVKPDAWIPAAITNLTGISNAMVEKAPPITAVLPEFLDFLGDDVILGHNVCFDLGFLRFACRHYLGRDLPNDYIDTLRLARKLIPWEPHHRLSDLERLFCLKNECAHRALSDARLTHHCYRAMMEQFGEDIPKY